MDDDFKIEYDKLKGLTRNLDTETKDDESKIAQRAISFQVVDQGFKGSKGIVTELNAEQMPSIGVREVQHQSKTFRQRSIDHPFLN